MSIYFFLQHLLFAVAIFGVSAFVTWQLIRHLKFLDVPNDRSSHVKATPRGGGVAIVSGFLIGIFLIQWIGDKTPIYTRYFLGFAIASFVIAALSFYDDFKHCSFKVKLAGQIIAIFVAMLSGIVIDVTYLPWLGEVHWGWWAYPLTFLWIVGLTNAYNFIDGLDGIAASTAVIAAGFLSLIAFQHDSTFIYLAAMTLSAASLGFLIFNLPPAKIFMGDVGSTFLGLVFAVMAIIAARYDHSHTSLFVMPLLLFHFIFDTAFTFVRRLLRGENVFQAHRTHLYQLLNRFGYSHGKVTMLYSAMAISQGLAAVWMASNLGNNRPLMYVPFLVMHLVYAGWVIGRAKKRGII
jgi:UDP-GlcNAc:undecaprenyl-phosphate GlcNAc-1-phosphate transferase